MKTTKGQREALRKWCSATYGIPINGELAKAVLALLDDLEEAERLAEYDLAARDFALDRARKAEARLASLVAAAGDCPEYLHCHVCSQLLANKP